MSALRDYQYVSDSKIESLFPQIPKDFLAGVSAKIGFNFALVSGEVSSEPPAEKTRIAKFAAFEAYLENQNLLKSTVTPQSWARGRFVAKAGFLTEQKGLVFFAGKKGRQAIILAGSESNLISGSPHEGSVKGWSFMPRILRSLEEYIKRNYDLLDVDLLDVEKDLAQVTDTAGFTAETYIFGRKATQSSAHSALYDFDQSLPGPGLLMNYVARIFLVGTNTHDESIAIGSPIAVWIE